MTLTSHPRSSVDDPTRPRRSVFTTLLTAAGVAGAAIGAYIAFGPDDRTLTLFAWSWKLAEISEAVASFLMVGGGLASAYAMSVQSAGELARGSRRWSIVVEGSIILAGLLAVIVGIVLLF